MESSSDIPWREFLKAFGMMAAGSVRSRCVCRDALRVLRANDTVRLGMIGIVGKNWLHRQHRPPFIIPHEV